MLERVIGAMRTDQAKALQLINQGASASASSTSILIAATRRPVHRAPGIHRHEFA